MRCNLHGGGAGDCARKHATGMLSCDLHGRNTVFTQSVAAQRYDDVYVRITAGPREVLLDAIVDELRRNERTRTVQCQTDVWRPPTSDRVAGTSTADGVSCALFENCRRHAVVRRYASHESGMQSWAIATKRLAPFAAAADVHLPRMPTKCDVKIIIANAGGCVHRRERKRRC